MGIKDYMSQTLQENDCKTIEIPKRKCQHDGANQDRLGWEDDTL